MTRLLLVALLMSLLILSGCQTMADARSAQGQGVSRVFDVPIDTVWKTLPPALESLGLPVAASNREEGYVLAEHSASAFSWGERVAVFVSKVSDGQTRVEVVSKRALQTNITATDWGPRVLQRIGELLAK